MIKPLYRLLNLAENASELEIKTAFRSLSKHCHPNNPANKNNPALHQQWLELQEAYQVLSDPERRNHYDLTGQIAPAAPLLNPEHAKALAKASDLFLQAFSQAHDLAQCHVIEGALQLLEHENKNLEQQRQQARRQQQRFEEVRTRLSKKDASENPIDAALRSNIREIDLFLTTMQGALNLNRRVETILQDYEYATTPPPPPPQPTVFQGIHFSNATSTRTWG